MHHRDIEKLKGLCIKQAYIIEEVCIDLLVIEFTTGEKVTFEPRGNIMNGDISIETEFVMCEVEETVRG